MRLFSHHCTARTNVGVLVLAVCLGLSACSQESSEALVSQAKASIAAGDTKAAGIHLKNAIAADKNNANARYELGKLYLDQLNFASAEKEFRRAREAGFVAATIDPLIARTLLKQREFQRLLDEFPAPSAETADTATLEALRATAQIGLGQREAARKTLEATLQRAPGNIDVHLALAHLALASNDVKTAFQSLGQALQIDPNHRDSLMLNANLLRATGKTVDASEVYHKILKIEPNNIQARLSLAGIAIAAQKPKEARKEVDTVLKISPGSFQARYTQALIDFVEKKPEAARDHLAPVLRAAPDYVPALLLGGSIEYALGNLQTAETHLNKVLTALPGNPYAVRLLAAAQLRLGRPEDAEKTLAGALKSPQPDPGVLLVAGEIALAQKDFSQASTYFEQAARRNPDDASILTELGISRLAEGDRRAMVDLEAAASMAGNSGRADQFIILTHLNKKDFDAALRSIDALEKKQPGSPLVWNYRGAAYLGKQDTVRARESFEKALRIDSAFFPAAANLAQIDIKEKNPAAARQRFEAMLKAKPSHLNAMLALADLGLLSNDQKTYAGWLEKAAAAHPKALRPRVSLARYQLAKGDRNKALSYAREAVSLQPDNPVALELLGTTQLAADDATGAVTSYRKWVERQPGQAIPLIKLATAQIVARDTSGARKTLQNVLRIQPDSLDGQMLLAGIEIQEAHYPEALKHARQIQQQHPAARAGFQLEGDAALARKDYASALNAYEHAHKVAPAGELLVRQLSALNRLKRGDEGEKRLVAWLADHADDDRTRAALGQSLIGHSQYKAAAEQYLILNTRQPNNPIVLNNLAWSLAESQDKRAIGFAEQALKLTPDNAAVMDTLGWILVRQGQSERGIKLLKDALSKMPDAAETQFHLASAYARSGDQTRAQGELERLLGSGTHFPQEQEARTLLGQLKNKTR